MEEKASERIKDWIAAGKIAEVVAEFEKIPEEKRDKEWLFSMGELYYRAGRHTDALNKFNAFLRLEPEHKQAAAYVRMIHGILDFFCKDLLNP